MKRKRICIDTNSIVSLFVWGRLYGVGRTTLELMTAISKIRDEFDFDLVLYSQNMKGYGGRKLELSIPSFHLYLPYRKPVNDVLNKFRLKEFLLRSDLYHIPHNADYVGDLSKTIFTIHDLMPYRYPEMWNLTDAERSYHKLLAERCKAIITCSESSKADILHYWAIAPEKVVVIPWGINREVFKPTNGTACLQKNNIKAEDYYLCTSCNHPRKNLPLLLSAYMEYAEKGGSHQLVLLNPIREYLLPFQSLIDEGRVIILKDICDEELVELYSQAKATLVLSLCEGFGLPVLESLACHTPVISSYNSSLIEAGGEVTDFIHELSQECVVEKLFEYEKQEKSKLLDIAEVELHLSRFSWERCARETMMVYRDCL